MLTPVAGRQFQTDTFGPDLDVLPGSEVQQYLHPLDSRNKRTPVLVLLEMALTGFMTTGASTIVNKFNHSQLSTQTKKHLTIVQENTVTLQNKIDSWTATILPNPRMLDLIATKKKVKVYTSNEKFFFDNNLSGIVQKCRKVIKNIKAKSTNESHCSTIQSLDCRLCFVYCIFEGFVVLALTV